jgi:hypothetical protein
MRVFKTASLVILISIFSVVLSAAKESAEAVPVIEVENLTYEFKQVSQGEIVKHDFRIFNRGTAPLEIRKVKPG